MGCRILVGRQGEEKLLFVSVNEYPTPPFRLSSHNNWKIIPDSNGDEWLRIGEVGDKFHKKTRKSLALCRVACSLSLCVNSIEASVGSNFKCGLVTAVMGFKIKYLTIFLNTERTIFGSLPLPSARGETMLS